MADNSALKKTLEDKLASLTALIESDTKTFFTNDQGVVSRQPIYIHEYPVTGAWERGFDDGQLRGQVAALKEVLALLDN